MEILDKRVEKDSVKIWTIPNGNLFEYVDSLGITYVAIVRGAGKHTLPAKGFHKEIRGTILTYCLTTKKDLEFDYEYLITPLVGKLEVSYRN